MTVRMYMYELFLAYQNFKGDANLKLLSLFRAACEIFRLSLMNLLISFSRGDSRLHGVF